MILYERETALWLCSINELELSEKHKLYRFYGDYQSLFEAALSGNIADVFSERVKSLTQKSARSFDPSKANEKLHKAGARFVWYNDKEYPERLKKIDVPPLGFFVIGELPDEKNPAIAIIGSRTCSRYGLDITARFSSELAAGGVSIISGLAMGIDGASHEAALQSGGKTVGILGNGIGSIYPKENSLLYEKMIHKGAVISEYFVGCRSLPNHFPERNRLIAGMSDGVLVVEARKKSGTMITVGHCLAQGKDVYVIPGRIDDPLSEGCLELIKNGAMLVTNPKDIAFSLKDKFPEHITYYIDDNSQYSFEAPDVKKSDLNEEEKIIYKLLDSTPKHFDELMLASGKNYFELLEILDSLQEKGSVKESSPEYFSRI